MSTFFMTNQWAFYYIFLFYYDVNLFLCFFVLTGSNLVSNLLRIDYLLIIFLCNTDIWRHGQLSEHGYTITIRFCLNATTHKMCFSLCLRILKLAPYCQLPQHFLKSAVPMYTWDWCRTHLQIRPVWVFHN